MNSLLVTIRSHLVHMLLMILVMDGSAQAPFTAIFAGNGHGFYLRSDGATWATGEDADGQFGNGSVSGLAVPTAIPPAGLVSVAVGERFALFLTSDGTVMASGSNDFGQFGNGATAGSDVAVQVMTGVKAIAAGANHSLFLKVDGSVWACGLNDSGQLGDGSTNLRTNAVQVMTGVKSVTAGRGFSLFLKQDGSVWATGSNGSGQHGDGAFTDRSSPAKVWTGVASISAGQDHSLFIKTDGTAWAVGGNRFGQLGDGTLDDNANPRRVLAGVSAVSAGAGHSLFLKSDGSVWATGFNGSGQLGDGTQTHRTIPVQVLSRVAAISAGSGFSLFLKRDGTVWSTGSNLSMQLGDGTRSDRANAKQMFFETRMRGISAGGGHSLFLKSNGTVWASGDNQFGQLGDGSTTSTDSPIQVFSGVKAVSAGRFHSVFIMEDGSAWSCGANSYGQLGNGATSNGATASPVQVLTDVEAVSAGDSHTLFLKTDGSVWACGRNTFGQLGDGTTTDRAFPVQISLTGVKAVSAGAAHSLFLKDDATAWAAGANDDGQLGIGPNLNPSIKSSPVQVLAEVLALDAGAYHSVFVKNDPTGRTYATGSNVSGELGDGTTDPVFFPKQVFLGGTDVSAGGNHTMFMQGDSIHGTGRNQGALADGGTEDRMIPVKTVTSGEKSVSAGLYHSLILLQNGGVLACGRNFTGQLGDGTREPKSTPVEVTGIWGPELVVSDPDGQRLGSGEVPTSFGNVNRGADRILKFTLGNRGYQELTGLSVGISGGNASDFAVVASPLPAVSPEGTTTISVRFAPSGNGARSTTLRITSNDPDESLFEIPILGIGVGVPEINVVHGASNLNQGAAVSYGSVRRGSDKTVSFSIRNTGTANLTGIAAHVVGGQAADYDIVTPPAASLIPNATTAVRVRFAPAAAGTRSAILRISSNDGDENPFEISISGTGVNVPEITILDGDTVLVDGSSSVSWGSVKSGSSKVLSLKVKNDGTASLANISASIMGAKGVQFAMVSPPAARLGPGRSTTFRIAFSPRGGGSRGATLKIVSNDADERSFEIRLSGTAAAASAAPPAPWKLAFDSPVRLGKAGKRITSQSGPGGAIYQVLTVDKAQSCGRVPVVEVSSDLIDWFSGPDHTAILVDDAATLKVRDLIPHSAESKRFIRLRWLGGP